MDAVDRKNTWLNMEDEYWEVEARWKWLEARVTLTTITHSINEDRKEVPEKEENEIVELNKVRPISMNGSTELVGEISSQLKVFCSNVYCAVQQIRSTMTIIKELMWMTWEDETICESFYDAVHFSQQVLQNLSSSWSFTFSLFRAQGMDLLYKAEKLSLQSTNAHDLSLKFIASCWQTFLDAHCHSWTLELNQARAKATESSHKVGRLFAECMVSAHDLTVTISQFLQANNAEESLDHRKNLTKFDQEDSSKSEEKQVLIVFSPGDGTETSTRVKQRSEKISGQDYVSPADIVLERSDKSSIKVKKNDKKSSSSACSKSSSSSESSDISTLTEELNISPEDEQSFFCQIGSTRGADHAEFDRKFHYNKVVLTSGKRQLPPANDYRHNKCPSMIAKGGIISRTGSGYHGSSSTHSRNKKNLFTTNKNLGRLSGGSHKRPRTVTKLDTGSGCPECKYCYGHKNSDLESESSDADRSVNSPSNCPTISSIKPEFKVQEWKGLIEDIKDLKSEWNNFQLDLSKKVFEATEEDANPLATTLEKPPRKNENPQTCELSSEKQISLTSISKSLTAAMEEALNLSLSELENQIKAWKEKEEKREFQLHLKGFDPNEALLQAKSLLFQLTQSFFSMMLLTAADNRRRILCYASLLPETIAECRKFAYNLILAREIPAMRKPKEKDVKRITTSTYDSPTIVLRSKETMANPHPLCQHLAMALSKAHSFSSEFLLLVDKQGFFQKTD